MSARGTGPTEVGNAASESAFSGSTDALGTSTTVVAMTRRGQRVGRLTVSGRRSTAPTSIDRVMRRPLRFGMLIRYWR
jgi:hypothetical protein